MAVSDTRGVVSDIQHDVASTRGVVSDIHHDVASTREIVSDIHRAMVKGQERTDSNNQTVSNDRILSFVQTLKIS